MPKQALRATGLVALNSLSYVEHVFALNREREPFVHVPDDDSAAPCGIAIARRIRPTAGGGWFRARHPLIREDVPAQIALTSGTEGVSKGIVLSFANLADTADRIIVEMELGPQIREYVGVPVTYSFGMGRIRAISAVGGWSYLPPKGFDPHELSRMLDRGEVNALSAVPTLLRILLQAPAALGKAAARLRWLEIGSQYMTTAEKRAVRALFPNARIVQHYGLTEASRSTFLRVSDVPDEQLGSVGQAAGRVEVDITSEGRIRIRGPHVGKWTVANGQLQPLTDADGWLHTSDLGHMKDGCLHFDGRADDVINSAGVKISPDLLEARVRSELGSGERIVVTRVPDALRGDGILVVAESVSLDGSRLRRASVAALKSMGLDAGDSLHAITMQTIPLTATGKPLRRVLASNFKATARPAAPALPESQSARSAGDVLQFFQQSFPGATINERDTFETLGGDSLRYIQFSMAFERQFGAPPPGWESLTVEQLQRHLKGSRRGAFWSRLETPTLTRAFFMVCIVALHLDTFVYSPNWGAAYFLFMLGGYSVMRFQWPEISRTGQVRTLLGTILRVAIPTVLTVAALQIWSRKLEVKPLLLISNHFDPHQYKVITFYFAEIYMQLLMLAAVLFAFRSVRVSFRRWPMTSSTVLLLCAIVICHEIELAWDTTYIFHREPHWCAWAFCCGMVMATARTMPTRAAALLIVGLATLNHFGLTSAAFYLIGGSTLVLFVPEITVPTPLKMAIGEIAAATFFMYLSHYQVSHLVTRIFREPMPWLALFSAILCGIVFARVYAWGEFQVRAFGRARGWRLPSLNWT